jgi:hypothetical protein
MFIDRLKNITCKKDEDHLKNEITDMLKRGELDNINHLIFYYRICSNYVVKNLLRTILEMKREEIKCALDSDREISKADISYESLSILEIINGC